MRAVRNAPPDVEIVDVDEPEGDGDLLRVVAAGICASDLLYLDYGSREIAGHEFAGVALRRHRGGGRGDVRVRELSAVRPEELQSLRDGAANGTRNAVFRWHE